MHFRRKIDKVSKGGKNPIDTPDGEGFTALHYAARYNNIDVMELLIEHGAGEISTFRSSFPDRQTCPRIVSFGLYEYRLPA